MISLFSLNDIMNASFVEINTDPFKGLWKVVSKSSYSDGNRIRITIDKNVAVDGDEVVLEFLNTNLMECYAFNPSFDTFSKSGAVSWPPPMKIEVDGDEFASLDMEDNGNAGFLLNDSITKKNMTFWEYENADRTKWLQITCDSNDYIRMQIGIRLTTINFESII